MASLKRAREEPSARVARTKVLAGTDLAAVSREGWPDSHPSPKTRALRDNDGRSSTWLALPKFAALALTSRSEAGTPVT